MSLGGALNIGTTALLSNQAAIEVTGNNLANVATPGYHRQDAVLSPISSQEVQTGIFIGRGVQLNAVQRQVDDALEGRIRQGVSDQSSANVQQNLLTQIESIQGELSNQDLSTQLNAYFNTWSQLANQPQDGSLRSLVIENGKSLASTVASQRDALSSQRDQVDTSIDQAAAAVNNDLTQIQSLNSQIANQEAGSGTNATLRDQRDQILGDLAKYMDISVNQLSSGATDVFVGSTPIILNGASRGVDVKRETVNGDLQITIHVAADGSQLFPKSGQLGALIQGRSGTVDKAINDLDSFTHQLINQVNQVYSQGQGLTGFSSVTSQGGVAATAAALNTTGAGLKFTPVNGSFQIHVTDTTSGQDTANVINVDLDGIGGNDTSLQDLANQLNTVAGVNASITADGKLQIAAGSSSNRLSFSDDSSGVLSALGINTFFSGSDASDIGVNQVIQNDPSMLAVGRGQVNGDNQNAIAVANLGQQKLADLNGQSLTDLWTNQVANLAVRTGQAKSLSDTSTVVLQNLQAQQQQTSGVSSDQEAINLMTYERAYQGAARFISVVDQMMQTLVQMI